MHKPMFQESYVAASPTKFYRIHSWWKLEIICVNIAYFQSFTQPPCWYYW